MWHRFLFGSIWTLIWIVGLNRQVSDTSILSWHQKPYLRHSTYHIERIMDRWKGCAAKARLNFEQSEQASTGFQRIGGLCCTGVLELEGSIPLIYLQMHPSIGPATHDLLRTLQANGDRSEGDTIEFCPGQPITASADEQYALRQCHHQTLPLLWDETIYDALIKQNLCAPPTNQWGLPEEAAILGWLTERTIQMPSCFALILIQSWPCCMWIKIQTAKHFCPELRLSTRLLSKIYTFTGLDRFYFTEKCLGINFKYHSCLGGLEEDCSIKLKSGYKLWQRSETKGDYQLNSSCSMNTICSAINLINVWDSSMHNEIV